jgi:hypothetical protein
VRVYGAATAALRQQFVSSATPISVQSMAKNPTVPYTSVSDVEAFFERVENIGEPKPPKKVDRAWVESYQFQTAHPAAIPSMLRWLGVINEDGESTGSWNDLRIDSKRQETLTRLVKEAYSAVFDSITVESANERDLRGAFVSAYDIGDPGRQIKCFLALCQQAGIKTAVEAVSRAAEPKPRDNGAAKPKVSSSSNSGPKPKATTRTEKHQPGRRRVATTETGESIHVRLNVEIPAEWSEAQIRARVAAVTRALEPADSGDS